jgi:hypothetical protein
MIHAYCVACTQQQKQYMVYVCVCVVVVVVVFSRHLLLLFFLFSKQLMDSMEKEKVKYTEVCARLRDEKAAIEHIQKIMTSVRAKLQSDFDEWCVNYDLLNLFLFLVKLHLLRYQNIFEHGLFFPSFFFLNSCVSLSYVLLSFFFLLFHSHPPHFFIFLLLSIIQGMVSACLQRRVTRSEAPNRRCRLHLSKHQQRPSHQ